MSQNNKPQELVGCAHAEISEKFNSNFDGSTTSLGHICLTCGIRFVSINYIKGAVKLLEDFKEMMDLSDHQHFTNKQFAKWEKLNDRFDEFKDRIGI